MADDVNLISMIVTGIFSFLGGGVLKEALAAWNLRRTKQLEADIESKKQKDEAVINALQSALNDEKASHARSISTIQKQEKMIIELQRRVNIMKQATIAFMTDKQKEAHDLMDLIADEEIKQDE